MEGVSTWEIHCSLCGSQAQSTDKQARVGKDVGTGWWEADLLVVLRARESREHGEGADVVRRVVWFSVFTLLRGQNEYGRETFIHSDEVQNR